MKVVCAVLVRSQKVLVAQRSDNQHWEFPGGKIQVGESPEMALSREIYEELTLSLPKQTWQSAGHYQSERLELLAYSSFLEQTDILLPRDHRAWAWVPILELPRFPLTETNQALLKTVQPHLDRLKTFRKD